MRIHLLLTSNVGLRELADIMETHGIRGPLQVVIQGPQKDYTSGCSFATEHGVMPRPTQRTMPTWPPIRSTQSHNDTSLPSSHIDQRQPYEC